MTKLKNIFAYVLQKSIKAILLIEIIEIRDDNNDTSLYFSYILLERRKKEITVKDKGIYKNIAELDTLLKRESNSKIPILTLINSDKLYHKIIKSQEHSNIVAALIPNTDPLEFTYQSYAFENETTFVSATRKIYVETILSNFGDRKNRIVKLFLGPSSLFETYKLIFNADEDNCYTIELDNYNLKLQNEELLDFKIARSQKKDPTVQKMININGQQIESNLVVLFSYGLLYYLDPLSSVTAQYNEVSSNNDEYNFRITSKPIVLTAAIILLISLLISTYLFSSYSSKYQELYSNKIHQLKTREQYDQTDSLSSKRTEILEKNGMNIPSMISYYADQITYSLPQDIYINKLEINPVNNNSNGEDIQFHNIILIKGLCYSSYELNEWVKIIKNNTWVKKITIREFIQENEDNIANFSIEIIK
jgi:hypothetical protein